jgi:hypothetical protein
MMSLGGIMMILATLFLCGIGGWVLGTEGSFVGKLTGAILWYIGGMTVVLGLPSRVLEAWIKLSKKKVVITISNPNEEKDR